RASASTPSTSSSRRPSACRASPTSTRTTRSSPPRWRRRAALRRRRRLSRKACLVRSRPAVAPQRQRFRSSLVVLVVAAPPGPRFVAPPRCAIEPLVHAPEAVQSARIGGIRVVDDAVLEREGAHARPFARVSGRVCSAHGRVGSGPLAPAFPRRLAPVVVFDAPLALLLLFSEADAEVGVEVAAERGRPRKRPPHPPLVRLQLLERRPRHRRKRDVVVRQVDDRAVEPVR